MSTHVSAHPSTPAGPARLGVVVVNFASHALLERNLVPLQDGPGGDRLRIVVVDNFSSWDERSAATALCDAHGWHLVAPAGNTGFGAGANLGAERALALGCDALLLLNPDASIDTADAVAVADAVRREPMTMTSPVITRPDGTVWFDGSTIDLRSGRVFGTTGEFMSSPTSWLTAACLFVGRELWTALGGFDERYFLYWEDVDLSTRCVAIGGTLQVAPDVTAIHDVGGTQSAGGSRSAGGDRAKSSTYYYYNCRNRLVYAARRLPARTALLWCLRTPVESWRILLRGGRRQLLASPRPLLAACGGSVAGLSIAVADLLRRVVRRPTSPAEVPPSEGRSSAAPAVTAVPDAGASAAPAPPRSA